MNNIKQWGNALFFSPSVRYANTYAYEKLKIDGEEYSVVLKCLIKKNYYTEHKHTRAKYDILKGEPEEVEYRVGEN